VEPVPLPVARPRIVTEPRNATLEAFRALGHPVRLELLAQVAARGPVCGCHLEADVGLTQPQISKHMSVLRRAGLVEARREGKWIYYTVGEEALEAARGFLGELESSMRRPHEADHCEDPA